MDKVEKIKEKVERLIEKAKQGDGEYFNGAWHTLITLTDFIDSLEEEPVSEDLKTLTYNYLRSYSKPEANVEYLTFASCVANWQKEQMIAKACKYLQEHKDEVETEDNGISGEISDEFIEKFKRAMGE